MSSDSVAGGGPAVGPLVLAHDIESPRRFAMIIVMGGPRVVAPARRAVRRTVDAGTGPVLTGFGVWLGLSSP